ncbi:MAG: phosphoribosyltransferase [Thermoplasmatota archaeon]
MSGGDELEKTESIESFRCKLVEWEEISRWTAGLAAKIRAGGYRPTVIIGLTRGGWIPARLLCDHLKVKKLYAVKTEHWGVTANPDGKALLTQELNVSIDRESVLVVDDITDTGESMTLALAHLFKMRPRELRTAALLHITHSKIEPEFYTVRVPKEKWTWFIFPWNRNEDMRTLTPKTLDRPKSVSEIRASFRKQFFINPSDALVRAALSDLEAEGRVERKGRLWQRAA